MESALFISDLHLCPERPGTTGAFFRFLDGVAREASALYILGDLFEYWVGDDQLDHDSLAQEVTASLAQRLGRGQRTFFMHGNRDFLIGERFARAAGMELLADPTLVEIGSQRILLMHGDTLCTDDVRYQAFRAESRHPDWQRKVLAMPYAERVVLARSLREQSDTEKAMKPENIMDVTPSAVEQAFRAWRYPAIVHGHTHRPATHVHRVDARDCTRVVLSDWHGTAQFFAVGLPN